MGCDSIAEMWVFAYFPKEVSYTESERQSNSEIGETVSKIMFSTPTSVVVLVTYAEG